MKKFNLIVYLLISTMIIDGESRLIADPLQPHVKKDLAVNGSANASVVSERIDESRTQVYLVKKSKDGKEHKALIWTSFWGNCTAQFSPEGKYLAVRDEQRLGLLSPIAVFRVADGALIYETPGCFEHQETAFSYMIERIESASIKITIVANDWSDGNSSRPKQSNIFTYEVNLEKRNAIRSSFNDSTKVLQK